MLGLGLGAESKGAECISNSSCNTAPLLQSDRRLSSINRVVPTNRSYTPTNRPLTPFRVIFARHSVRPDAPETGRDPRLRKRRAEDTPSLRPLGDAQGVSTLEERIDMPQVLVGIRNTETEVFVDQSSKRRRMCKAPSRTDAISTLKELDRLLHPPQNTGPGYKECKLKGVTRTRYESMAACLRLYLKNDTTFTYASNQAAVAAGKGVWCARRIRGWVQRFIRTGHLPQHRYGLSRRSLLKDEGVSNEITLSTLR